LAEEVSEVCDCVGAREVTMRLGLQLRNAEPKEALVNCGRAAMATVPEAELLKVNDELGLTALSVGVQAAGE
jgi:hypothetical protein